MTTGSTDVKGRGGRSWARALGRVLRPLLQPDYLYDRARAERFESAVAVLKERADRLTQDVARFDKRMARDRELLERDRDSAREQFTSFSRQVHQDLGHVRDALKQQERIGGRVLRQASREADFELVRSRVEARLAKLATGRGEIVVGPWTGEVGFELLYWAPFVRWAVQQYRLDPARLVIVSRGGVESWYAIAGARYLDVFSLADPAAFQAATAVRRKQVGLGAFDRALVRRARAALGVSRAGVLHPAFMYSLFHPVWKRQLTMRRLEEYTRHAQVIPPAPPLELPDRFVAARFYFSKCFPDTEANRALAGAIVDALSERGAVVLLNPGALVDDHHDWTPARTDRVHMLKDVPIERNLAVQTAVLAKASGFVGTYGGFAYLAPLLGIDALTLYSEHNFFVHHLDYAERMFEAVGGGRLAAVDVALVPLVAAALARPVDAP